MYVTRPLSYCIKHPETLSVLPEGPNSGFLVVQDEEVEVQTCCGSYKVSYLRELPFPQNKILTVESGTDELVADVDVVLIPVLNLPLSSNTYYAIQPYGEHKGKAYICSKEEDLGTNCFCHYVKDVKPKPLDPNDIYQQYEIVKPTTCCSNDMFLAKSLAEDSYPPRFLGIRRWRIRTKTPITCELSEALGINTALRACLPKFNFLTFNKSSESVIVGKWYCPFMFVKEGIPSDQMKKSMFYIMTLEQRWQQIFSCENEIVNGNSVSVDVVVPTEVAFVGGREVVLNEKNITDGMIWFVSAENTKVHTNMNLNIGLSVEIFQRIRWEQERVGWIGGRRREVRVKRMEEFTGVDSWKKFGCYVLVERFVLKRMNGSLVMNYDFKQTRQIRTIWS